MLPKHPQLRSMYTRKFKEFKPYTKTIVLSTNLRLHMQKLFEMLPITPYVVLPKKRGRKKKGIHIDPNECVQPGSIVSVIRMNKVRGVDMRKKKPKKKAEMHAKGTYFRNAVSLRMRFIGPKKYISINFFKTGVFQVTGCKYRSHAIKCLSILWGHIKQMPSCFSFSNIFNPLHSHPCKFKLQVIVITWMRNIRFDIGFLIDRVKIFHYIMNTSDNKRFARFAQQEKYSAVNIKQRLGHDIQSLRVYHHVFNDISNKWENCRLMTYGDYLNLIPIAEKNKKLNTLRQHSFFVFQSGIILMSGPGYTFMKDQFRDFLLFIDRAYEHVVEKLDQI